MKQSILNFHKLEVGKRYNFDHFQYIFGYIVIIFFAGLVYYPALDNSFIYWDDQYYVTENMYILQPTFKHLKTLLTKAVSLNYHPLTMVSFWINSYFFGTESATPYILTNVIIHTVSTICLYRFLLYLTNTDLINSLTCSALFLIHPMHVESVVWISERKDVLYGFFFILSLYNYTKWRDKKVQKYCIWAFIFFLCSCLSKAMAVSIVPCLFLIDIFKNKKWLSLQSILNKLPFIVFSLLIGLIAIDIQSGRTFGGYISNTNIDSATVDFSSVPIIDKISNASYGLIFYLKNFLSVSDMSAYHPYDWNHISSHRDYYLLASFIFLLIILISYQKNKKIFFGLSFFLATIFLVLQWIPVGSAIVADRYSYIPYIGLSYIVGYLLSFLSQYLKNRGIIWLIIFSILVILGCITKKQVCYWKNHTSLFSQSVSRYPNDPKSRILLATGYWTEGKNQKAIEQIEFAINTLGLDNSDTFEKLANCYADMNEHETALKFYNHSISLDSLNYLARYHRALILLEDNPYQAIIDFDICESSGFEYITSNIYGHRGVCHGRLKQYKLAIRDFTKAIELGNNLIENYKDRALTYDLIGNYELAKKDRESIKLLMNND